MITKPRNFGVKCFAAVIFFPTLAMGAQPIPSAAPKAEEFSYPELLVTPRASQRLEMEARKEFGSRWTTHLPLQLSALSTLVAGITQFGGVDTVNNDPNKRSPWVGVGVGSTWLVASIFLATGYRPYQHGWEEIAAMPARTEREQLTRERFAEEALERPRDAGRRLKWMSTITNLAASAYMIGNAQSTSVAKAADGFSMVAAFLPVLFPYHWSEVVENQQDYKKKIYGPVASTGLVSLDSSGQHPVPALMLSLNF